MKLNEKIDFLVPNINYVSYENSAINYSFDSGDSFACAVVTGIIALLISNGKTNFELNNIKKQLQLLSKPYSDKNSYNHLYIH